jgi:hypothetical protein
MLDELTKEMKEALAEYRAENHTHQETYDWFYVTYTDATRYAIKTYKRWARSPEGKRFYSVAQSQVKEDASIGVAEKDNRILAVMEVTTKIMSKLRELDAENKAFVPLNRELRENLKYIAEETGDRMTETVRDAFQVFRSNIESHDEWKRIAQKQGLLPQTPSN